MKQILLLKEDVRLKAVFIMNNWWHERDTVREGDLRRPAEQRAMLSDGQARETLKLGLPEAAPVSRLERGKWQAPQRDVLKVNVDGSLRERESKKRAEAGAMSSEMTRER